MVNFMRAAINAKRKYFGQPPMTAAEFLKLMREKRKVVELDSKLTGRSVNEGFSGGEKITHYQRMLDYLKPDIVHVLMNGRIVRTGGPELAKEIEERGFDWIKEQEN